MTRVVGVGGCRLGPRARRLFGFGALVLWVTLSFAFAASTAQAANNTLDSVACPLASQCTAVDDSGHEITFNPISGSLNASGTKVVMPGAALDTVACPSQAQCAAVSGEMVVTFDPASGQAQHRANLAPQNPDPNCPRFDPYNPENYCYVMHSVACPQASECVGVDETGKEVTFDPNSPASARWSTIQDGSFLQAVACSAPTQCTAVSGGLGTRDTEVTFDPTSGNANSAGVRQTGASGIPYGLACVSASQCTAADGGGNEVTFDPTAGTANHAGVKHIASYAMSVACASATQCTAVDLASHEVTFDPISGAVNAAGLRPVDPGGHLWGVACVSPSQCTAVDDGGKEVTFDPSTGMPNAAGVRLIDSLNSLVLRRAHLKVLRGRVQVPLSCQSNTACRGTLRIVAGSGRRLACTRGPKARFSVASGEQKTVKVRLRRSCTARLRAARGHRVAAAISARLSSGQHGLAAPIQLVLG